MLLIAAASILSVVATPILAISACASKLYSIITGNKPLDISRPSFIKEMNKYVISSVGLTSEWVCGGKIHVLCRHATIFSNYDPIVIIHGTGTGSFNYSEFMESFPKTYDIFCIDLPGWGISEDPPFDLKTADLNKCYAYYANVILTALSEVYRVKTAKYVFVGHSLGSLILTKCIAGGYIPAYRIHKCILAAAPGLHEETSKYAYFWGSLFISGILESMFKQWWSSYLFSAFLYRKETQLKTIQTMHIFIPHGAGRHLSSRQMAFSGRLFKPRWIAPIKPDIIHMFKYYCQVEFICGVHDTLVNYQHAKNVHEKIKCYELNGGHSLFLDKDLYPKMLDIITMYTSKQHK